MKAFFNLTYGARPKPPNPSPCPKPKGIKVLSYFSVMYTYRADEVLNIKVM